MIFQHPDSVVALKTLDEFAKLSRTIIVYKEKTLVSPSVSVDRRETRGKQSVMDRSVIFI